MKKRKIKNFYLILVIFIIILIFFVAAFLINRKNIFLNPDEEPFMQIKQDELSDRNYRLERMSRIKKEGSLKTISGHLEVIAIDYEDMRADNTEYWLIDSEEKRYLLYFNGEPSLVSGANIEVEGQTIFEKEYGEVAVERYVVEEAPLEKEILGSQRLAVVLVNFLDNPAEPINIEEANNRVFNQNNPNSINYWLRDTSYENANLVGNSFGWHRVNFNNGDACERRIEIMEQVMGLIDEQVDFRQFRYLMIVYNNEDVSCDWLGMATLGRRQYQTQDGRVYLGISWINGHHLLGGMVPIHELGHNFELNHANYFECGNSMILANLDQCQSLEYWDRFDTMGAAQNAKPHFNAFSKIFLRWFANQNYVNLNANQIPASLEYTLHPLEYGGFQLKAVNIRVNNPPITYTIEYRRPVGFDEPLGTYLSLPRLNGAMIRINRSSDNRTHLIDMTPHGGDLGSNLQWYDSHFVVLKPGRTFNSPHGFSITTLEANDNYLRIRLSNTQRVSCWSNQDCYDGNPDTQDSCINPGTTNSFCEDLPECIDGVDNDGDGLIDYNNDPGCTYYNDNNETDPIFCFDSDGGIEYYIKGYVQSYNNQYWDLCHGNGLVREYYCEGRNHRISDYQCPYGCTDGACRTTSLCYDSDGGIEYYTKGYVQYYDNQYWDLCYSDGLVREYYCEGNNYRISYYQCPYGCTDGACRTRWEYCRDGIDNDNDGGCDWNGCTINGVAYPADFSCQGNMMKDDETYPKAQCQDGIDNDNPQDLYVDYPEDPGCVNTQDNDEGGFNPGRTQCSNNIDDDGDRKCDFGGCTINGKILQKDPECVALYDNSEAPHIFVVRNNAGTSVAQLFDDGRVYLAGRCSIKSQCKPPANSFIIRNSAGANTGFIDSAGNMCALSGSCEAQQSCPVGSEDFVIKDELGVPRFVFKSSGNLCHTGAIVQKKPISEISGGELNELPKTDVPTINGMISWIFNKLKGGEMR